MNSAEKCLKNGWCIGTRLVGDEGYGPTVIEITALGRENILAFIVSQDGKPAPYWAEGIWTLAFRDWKKVEPEKSGG